jgi:hypothetical protein
MLVHRVLHHQSLAVRVFSGETPVPLMGRKGNDLLMYSPLRRFSHGELVELRRTLFAPNCQAISVTLELEVSKTFKFRFIRISTEDGELGCADGVVPDIRHRGKSPATHARHQDN